MDSLLEVAQTASRDTHQINALNELGRLLQRQDLPQANAFAEQALLLSDSLNWAPGKALALGHLANVARRKADFDTALDLLEQSAEVYQEMGNEPRVASRYGNMGWISSAKGDYEAAFHWYGKALELYQSLDHLRGQAQTNNSLGLTYFRQSQFDLAAEHLELAISQYQALKDTTQATGSLSNLGVIYQAGSNLSKAMECYERSLTINEQRGDSAGMASDWVNLGTIYHELAEYETALETYELALATHISLGSVIGEANTRNSMGASLAELGRTEAAIEAYETGLALYESQNQLPGIASSLISLGAFSRKAGELSTARSQYQRGLEISETIGNPSLMASALRQLAEVALQEQQFSEGLAAAQRSLDISQQIGSLDQEGEAQRVLSELYEAQNRPAQAFRAYRAYTEIQDSIQSEEQIRSLTQTEMRYTFQREQYADSITFVRQQATAKAEYQATLDRRTYLLVGGLILGLLGFLLFRYRQRLRLKEQALALEQEQAKQAQLLELDAMKSRFFTNISHEFRTPLTVILGMAGQLSDQDQQARSLIRRNGQHLLRLINQVLDLARLESHELPLHLVQDNVIAYLRYLLESFHSLAVEREIQLAFEADPTELIMDYDSEKLQDVVYNLLSNALKFTPAGGKVQLQVEQQEKQIQISVRDDGPGIPATEQAQVFDRFFQVSTTQTINSSGVGLALAKGLVERMGGKIHLESHPGKGSTFFFHLPVELGAATPSAFDQLTSAIPRDHAHFASPPEPVLIQDPEAAQILIIEDNPDVVAYLGSILGADYQLLTAKDGEAGIQLAQAHIPDLIISDVMMPRKDGYEVTQLLKADARTSHIPVILLTAKATQKDRITGLQEGADAFLTKPFDRTELMVRIHKLLELRTKLQAYYRSLPFPEAEPTSAAIRRPTLEEQFMGSIQELVENRFTDPELTVHELSEVVHLSHTQMYRKLKALTGQSPNHYIRAFRLKKGKTLLQTTDLSISEIAYDVGFNDPNYFSRAFVKEFGMRPTEVRSTGNDSRSKR
ncbi:MAG: tetratricopeptide repeat protein [Bacteroidota bacterium]